MNQTQADRYRFDALRTLCASFFALLALLSLTLPVHAQSETLRQADKAYRGGDYKQALTLIEQAEQSEGTNPVVYQAKGSTLRKLGDTDGARTAWEKMVQLDPNLRTVRNKDGFRRAFAEVGGQIAENPTTSTTSRPPLGANPIIAALTSGNSWVDPILKGDVDASRVDSAAAANKKIVVTSTVAPYRSPTEMASELRKALNLGEGVVVVVTPNRVGASSGRISSKQIEASLQKAGLNQAMARGGLTDAATTAAGAVENTVTTTRNTSNGINGGMVILGIAGIFGFFGWRQHNRTKALSDAKSRIEPLRKQALDGLSYADGYLDLLPEGEAATQAKALRATAYEKYETAGGIVKQATTPETLLSAQPLLEESISELTECRRQIDIATGGTGVVADVASNIPSLATADEKASAYLKAEQVRNADEARRLQYTVEQIPEDQRGVSFFSGQPLPANQLVPVTLVVGGRKQTVMASRDEADQIQQGRMPQVRAFDEGNGRYVPWYEYRGYDPYRDYYGGWGRPYGSFVDFYLLSQFMGGGLFGGYGGWGYPGYGWGMPPVMVYGGGGYGYAGYPTGYGVGSYDNDTWGGGAAGQSAVMPNVDAQPIENAGGFDFFGQSGYNDTAPQDGGFFGNDSGTGDMGNFFGGDSSGDSGGGGFDFGGGDFGGGGGGDFGGGGD